VILNRPVEQRPEIAAAAANVVALRTARVNGTVYAFDRQTGKYNWYVPVANQMVLLERFGDLPMMLFTARFNRPVSGGAYATPVVATLSIDKRTGKRLRDSEEPNYPPRSAGLFSAIAIDRRAGTFDLVAHNLRLRHYIAEPGFKTSSDNDSVSPKPKRDSAPTPGGVRPVEVPQKLIPQRQPAPAKDR